MKRLKFILFILIIVLSAESVYSQRSRKVNIAFETYRSGEYYNAIELLKEAYNLTNDRNEKTEIVFLVAECYRKIRDPKKAEMWYKKAVIRGYPDPRIYMYYGDMLKMNENYEEAIAQYEIYKDLVPDDVRAQLAIESCQLALEWLANPNGYEVENMEFFNSRDNDFAPAYANPDYSEVYFTSSREGATGTATHGATNQNFVDIFTSTKDRKGSWSEPVPLGEEINSEFEDGFASLTQDQNTMYFTRCRQNKNKTNGCVIMKASRQGEVWAKAEELDLGSDSIVISHPSISPDELTLYFVSDLDGTIGKYDLWKVTRESKTDEWGSLENLGPQINTTEDEMFPYLHSDGTLYFSSTGHKGIGGLDIYKAKLTEEGTWTVENMKYPINSPSDDFGIVFESEYERGYFTSNRTPRGDDDIFQFMLPPLKFNILGKVADEQTEDPLPNAIVRSIGSDGITLETKTNNEGEFKFMLKPGTDYLFVASKPGYLNGKERESTKGLTESKDFKSIIYLASIAKPIQLENIFWDYNSAELRPESTIELEKLVETLNDNPNITIELGSHTDNRGSEQFNQELSQRRAQAVVNFLIDRGIASDRLVAKGYGESKPQQLNAKLASKSGFFNEGDVLSESFINNLQTPEEQEMAHQINRRTEFRVLRTDYVPAN